MSEPIFRVMGYNSSTKVVTDSYGNLFSLVRTINRRNGNKAYEVKGYSKIAGLYPELEQVYELRGEAEAVNAAIEIAKMESAKL